MKTDYLCPHCLSFLNVGENIVISIKKLDGKTGIIFLHTEIGNYSVQSHQEFTLEKDEIAHMYCPVCHKSIEADTHKNLARLIMRDEKGLESVIVFSRIFGEQATYKIEGTDVLSYGEQMKKYMDPEWFL